MSTVQPTPRRSPARAPFCSIAVTASVLALFSGATLTAQTDELGAQAPLVWDATKL